MFPAHTSCDSMIKSFLGPNKSFKLIVCDGDEQNLVSCPLAALQTMVYEDPMMHIVEQTLEAHHRRFGFGTTTLLAMWHFWHSRFRALLEEGLEMACILNTAREMVKDILSLLPSIQTSLQLILKPVIVDIETHTKTIKSKMPLTSPSLFASSTTPQMRKVWLPSKTALSGVMLKSRHLSTLAFNVQSKDEEDHKSREDHNLNNTLTLSEQSRNILSTLTMQLSHCESNFSDVLATAWIHQIQHTKSIRFREENVSVWHLAQPSFNAFVLPGLILKSKRTLLFDPNLKEQPNVLLINGDITMDFMHLGFAPKVSIKFETSFENLKIGKPDLWTRQCTEKLKKLQVTLLFVRGSVDENIESFCESNCISLIWGIPWSEFKMLMGFMQDTPPVTYLLDSTYKDVSKNVKAERWTTTTLSRNGNEDLVLVSNQQKVHQTIIVSHPLQAAGALYVHQLRHCISRLSSSLKSFSVLPGLGKTEQFCSQQLEAWSESGDESRKKVTRALSDGFEQFASTVWQKYQLNSLEHGCVAKPMDDIFSKTQAWHSALALSLITANTQLNDL